MAAEPITHIAGKVSVPYRWSYGRSLTRFFHETKVNRRLMGARCTKCQKVVIPSVALCGRCFALTDQENLVVLGNEGTLVSWTTVYLPFPGQPTDPPYTYGFVKIDGADNNFPHLIHGDDETKLQVGTRMRVVWNENRTGTLFDIKYLEPIL